MKVLRVGIVVGVGGPTGCHFITKDVVGPDEGP